MSKPFFVPVDSTSFQVFYSLKEKRLVMPDELVGSMDRHVALIKGPQPDPLLHRLMYRGQEICRYNLNEKLDTLVLENFAYRWGSRGLDTQTLVEQLEPLMIPNVTAMVSFILNNKLEEAQSGVNDFIALTREIMKDPNEEHLHSSPIVRALVKSLSERIAFQALEEISAHL